VIRDSNRRIAGLLDIYCIRKLCYGSVRAYIGIPILSVVALCKTSSSEDEIDCMWAGLQSNCDIASLFLHRSLLRYVETDGILKLRVNRNNVQ
jgi:hypothetical protein